MSVTGKQRENTGEKKLYVGLTVVEPKAFNPTRKELNKLLGIDDKEEDTDILYSSQDQEGNERQRMTFWLYDKNLKQYFVHSFLLTKKLRTSKDKAKVQIINSTCDTTWVPFKIGEGGVLTDEPDYEVAPGWFKSFISKDKEILGNKSMRPAFVGEEEFGIFLKAWLGKMNWRDKDTEVIIDAKQIFKEKYNEVRELVNGSYSTPFIALIGVRTDPENVSKKYQQVYSKKFLPSNFEQFINNGFVFPADRDGKPNWNRREWEYFEKEIRGEYGPTFYVELCALKEYDLSKDITASTQTKSAMSADTSEY